jgi:sarcosine oxidase subunit alpha
VTKAGAMKHIEIRTATLAAGLYADHWIALVDERRLVKMRAKSVVLASGACEQPAVFGNNDLPGVMLATAAQRLVHQFAVKPFNRGVILTANDEGYRAAVELHRAGAAVTAIVDLRSPSLSAPAAQAARDAGIQVHTGHAICRAVPASGKKSIRGALVAPLDAHGKPDAARAFQVEADGIAMSVGWAPADGLFYQAGGRMMWSDTLQQFIPKSAPTGLFPAGRMNGVFGLDEQLADGRRAGQAAAAHLGLSAAPSAAEPPRPTVAPSHSYPIFPDSSAKCFVDLDEDVQYKDFVRHSHPGENQR